LEVRVVFVWLFVSRVGPAALGSVFVVWSCIVSQGRAEVVGVPRLVSKVSRVWRNFGAEANMQKPSGKWCEATPARDGVRARRQCCVR
jgi:hypothetical protein